MRDKIVAIKPRKERAVAAISARVTGVRELRTP